MGWAEAEGRIVSGVCHYHHEADTLVATSCQTGFDQCAPDPTMLMIRSNRYRRQTQGGNRRRPFFDDDQREQDMSDDPVLFGTR